MFQLSLLSLTLLSNVPILSCNHASLSCLALSITCLHRAETTIWEQLHDGSTTGISTESNSSGEVFSLSFWLNSLRHLSTRSASCSRCAVSIALIWLCSAVCIFSSCSFYSFSTSAAALASASIQRSVHLCRSASSAKPSHFSLAIHFFFCQYRFLLSFLYC